ncbi:MAG: trypsin-like peptidase domain-containing protein [Deltaproteobacteria bacterium]|nr:trypsin-like peptidase domain-containing protein [Deltaproteobacteria bacterium]
MPLVVEILSGSRRGDRLVLEKPTVTFGRHPDNDVVFDGSIETQVSAFHAEAREIGPGRWVFADRGSSNGSWAGAERLRELMLEGRVEVRLAQSGPRLALVPLAAVPAQAGDAFVTPAPLPQPPGASGLDPLVVAPTVDGPAAAWRGPARIGRLIVEPSPPGGAPVPRPPPGEPAAGRASRVGPPEGDEVPPWQRTAPPPGPAMLAGTGLPVTTTQRIRAVAGDMVRRSSRRFWTAIAVLAVLLVGTGVLLALVVAGVVSFGEAGAGAERAQGAAPPAVIDAGATASAAAPITPSAKEIAAENRDAIFLLGAELLGKSEGFCTGFALTARILATNAHCVIEMRKIWEALGNGQGVYAYQNEHPGVKFRVLFALMDPGYKEDESDAIYPDIGLAVIEGRAPREVRLASKSRALELHMGDHVYLLGFPGALNSAESPVATLTSGIVERLTDLGQRMAPPEGSVLIQHSAYTTKGTSGSPLFNDQGEVIGINTGYYRGESEQQRLDPVTGRVRGEMVTQDLQTYAIGMRVDLVHDLLRLLYERIPGTREEDSPARSP